MIKDLTFERENQKHNQELFDPLILSLLAIMALLDLCHSTLNYLDFGFLFLNFACVFIGGVPVYACVCMRVPMCECTHVYKHV